MLKTLTVLMMLAAPASAQTFDGTLDTWLAGDDKTALTAFADLARGGDADAQLFLGQIASQAHYWPAEVAALPRKERNALLRAPGGLSGKSWTAIAAETDPRAQAFDGVTRIGEKTGAMATLLEMGEIATVEKAWPGFISSGTDWEGALRLAMHPAASEAMRLTAPGLDDIVKNGSAATTPLVMGLRRSELRWRDALVNLDLLTAEGNRISQMADMGAFVRFCETACSGDAALQCVGAIWSSSSGDPALLVTSPVEQLLSTERYRESPRAVRDVARAINQTQFRLDQSEDPALSRLSSCAWDAVQASNSASQ